jgi:hypothetical protein
MRTKLRSKVTLLFMTLGLVLAIPAVALADNIVNDVVVGGNDTITAGGSTTINYRIVQQPAGADGQAGCNAADGSAANVTINTPAGVTATPGSLTFNACQSGPTTNSQAVVFSSNTPGDYNITASVSDSGAGTYSTTPANFTLHVNAATLSDTTPPDISYVLNPASPDGANGWYKSDVTLTWTVTENESAASLVKTGCDDQNITADQAETTYSCSATSDGGSAGPVNVSIKRDATNPNVALVGGPTNGTSYKFGSVPAAPTCDASDATSGLDGTCSVSGYSTAVGTHTVKAEAKDLAGNTNSASSTYTVDPYTLNGFFQPVDMGIKGNTDLGTAVGTATPNSAKAGQTIPLKFEIFNGTTELTDTSQVKTLVQQVGCTSLSGPEDLIENYATGGTSLRYDTTGGQFIFNWQMPKGAGGCYKVTMTAQDNSFITAYFTLKK